jgi:hypothetical protein
MIGLGVDRGDSDMQKITYTAQTREIAISMRQHLQHSRQIPTGRSGREIYFFGHIDWGYSKSDWQNLLSRIEREMA